MSYNRLCLIECSVLFLHIRFRVCFICAQHGGMILLHPKGCFLFFTESVYVSVSEKVVIEYDNMGVLDYCRKDEG